MAGDDPKKNGPEEGAAAPSDTEGAVPGPAPGAAVSAEDVPKTTVQTGLPTDDVPKTTVQTGLPTDDVPKTAVQTGLPTDDVPEDDVPHTHIRAAALPDEPLTQIRPDGAVTDRPAGPLPEEERIDREPPIPPWKPLAWLAGGLVAAALLFVAVDVLLLRGQEIAVVRGVEFDGLEATRDQQTDQHPRLIIPIEHVGRRHTLVIGTYPQEIALRWTLVSPEGWEVTQGSDILRTDRPRTTHFTPNTSGPHVLEIRRVATQTAQAQHRRLQAAPQDRVHVTVRVGDRSVLERLRRNRTAYDRPPLWLQLGG